MWDALTHLVVRGNKGAFGLHSEGNGFRHELSVCEERCDQLRVEIWKRRKMLFGNQENVAGEERAVVKKSDRDVVFEYDVGGSSSINDIAEYALT